MITGRDLKCIFGIILVLCFTVSLQVSGQKIGYYIDKNKKKVYVPFKLYNNLVVVPVILNNRLPLNFVVDTGVRSSIITDRVITDMLDLPYNRKITINGPGDYTLLEAYVVTQVELAMEGVHGFGQAVLVLEKDYLQLRNYLGTEVHGIIGWDIFNRFVVEFDYVNEVMILHEPKSYKPRNRYSSFPIIIEDTKPYLITKIQVNDSTTLPAKLMIDTGASHAIMLNRRGETEILMPDHSIHADLGRGLGGKITGQIGRISQIEIGDFIFNDLIASFPDPESYPDTISFANRNGTLGGEILTRFSVIFDYHKKTIYLKKSSGFKKSFEFNMSGLTVSAKGDGLNTFSVELVRENSPADKVDIREGDVITSINGYQNEDVTLNQIYQLFNSKEGKSIRLGITRKGKNMKKRFDLERIL
ncbi:aspartyl protease family protein [Bacteroidota bacterium]